MNERIIPISPYVKADNLIDLVGHVSLDGIKEDIEIPKRNHLILYKYSLPNEEAIIPRDHVSLKIYLKPIMSRGHSINDFQDLLINGESPIEVLKLVMQVSSEKTRWCSNQISMNLIDVNGSNEIYFDIPISEIKGEVVVAGYVVRMIGNKINELRKASAPYSVLSNCEDIHIQIDELKEIGGNHLPIDYEDLSNNNMVFDIQGLDKDYEIPRIKCAKDFEEYFVKDDLLTVNSAFMMAMFYFLDAYLKWLIFKCKYDQHEKNHQGLVDMFSRFCGVSKADLVELIEDTKYSEDQTKNYLSLSHRLITGIQVNSPIKYAKEFKQLIIEELR